MDLKERAKQIMADIPAVLIAMKDEKTPFIPKLLAGLTIAYVLSPIDLIPDFIPVLGYLDDVLLVPALIALTVRHIPPEVWERSRKAARGQTGKPKRWYYAIPAALFWLMLLWLIARALWR
jgi:uncharacterized membrane protein YkvA (DUF1232 family)